MTHQLGKICPFMSGWIIHPAYWAPQFYTANCCADRCMQWHVEKPDKGVCGLAERR